MVIKPKIRGFICTTAHPVGCSVNVQKQINYVKSCKTLKNGPNHVLIIGASTGYGLASRINAAFGSAAATIGVFLEKPSIKGKTASSGWYNSAAFDKAAKTEKLYSKSINGDAFSDECRQNVISLIQKDLGKIDLVVYSLASPVRRMPGTSEVARSTIKTIGETYKSIALDSKKELLVESIVEPANEKEISDTIKVMGGQDWELWINALYEAGVLSNNVQTVAYSYIGPHLTWPIYWKGTLGKAKKDLDRAAKTIDKKLKDKGGSAYVAVLKSVVTQASSAIPIMPLYISIIFKIMKEKGIHEGCIEQIRRLFSTKLYSGMLPETDDQNRLRLDDLELRNDVQVICHRILANLQNHTINTLTDYQSYKADFLRLFGFGLIDVDYDRDVSSEVNFDVINLLAASSK